MFSGFWSSLPQTAVGLSPMDGVTDQPYRYLQQKYSQPDIIMTEFTSAEGVSRNAIKLFRDFAYDESQRPIVAQIFGKEPESFYATAIILGYLGFDGIDINMGCPAKNVSQHGAGAALILTPKLAQEIVRATQKGVQDWANGITLESLPTLKEKTKKMILERHDALPVNQKERRHLPVSVKTRIGFDIPVVSDWMKSLLEVEPAAISVHGRTLKQLYGGRANWEVIAEAAEIIHNSGLETKALGNGDLQTPEDVKRRVEESGVDGVLIGRATFGDPWLIGEMKRYRDSNWSHSFSYHEPTVEDRITAALEHAIMYEKTYPGEHFLPMRKHLAWYIKGFPFASDYRTRLVLANSADEVASVFEEYLATTKNKNVTIDPMLD